MRSIGGHRVVLTARTLKEALDIIPRFKERGVQVVLVDGNLSSGDLSGLNGKMIVEAIRSQVPEVKTIGTSASGYVAGVDKNYDPWNDSPEDLVKLVTDL